MVGVGGRSGGCHTCRRRRVKCDETHPTCQRCAKAKIVCEGYARDLKFVDEKGRAQKRVQIKRQAYLESIEAEEKQIKAERRAKSESPNKQTTPPIDPILSLEGMRDEIKLQFTLNKLFSGWQLFLPWVMDGYRGTKDCTTTQSVNALSCVYFGRMHGDRKTFDMGMSSYSNALRLLGADLKNPNAAFSVPAVTNVLALVIFEMMACSRGGMIQHLGGVQRMIQARGPERHQSRPALDVFEACRTGIIHNYMSKRKRCFLEEPAWTTVPWAKHPQMKTLFSRISDRKAHMPGLLEDIEAWQKGELTSQSDVQRLCQEVYVQINELYMWRAAWEAQNPNCCWTVPVDNPKAPYSSALYFNSLSRAVEIGHYSSILLLLYRMGHMLMGPTFSIITPATSIQVIRTNPGLLLPSDPKTPHDVAIEVLQLIPYEFQKEHQNGGYFQMMHPLRATFEAFAPGTKEWDYCASVFKEIADDGGFEIARRIMPNGFGGRLLWDEENST